ncbi:hypothetical protein MCHI_001994 [Candidatus Magnetoovum chiemensis]|nr:hypothetical protein MCHI_001994 [Candidatus Magnetoovum chiemensis]
MNISGQHYETPIPSRTYPLTKESISASKREWENNIDAHYCTSSNNYEINGNEALETILNFAEKIISSQTDIPIEYLETIDKHFLDMLA